MVSYNSGKSISYSKHVGLLPILPLQKDLGPQVKNSTLKRNQTNQPS